MKEKGTINIEKLIGLATFDVSEEEKGQLEKELEDFLEYARVINNAPCQDMKPVSHAVYKDPYLREDESETWADLDMLIKNGPSVLGTNYIAPPQKGRTGIDEKSLERNVITEKGIEYEAVIGLEVHAQLNTKTKLFCKCSTEFGRESNSNTCPVCSGHPGVLPVLNKEAVNMAILAGLAAKSTVNNRSIFARKNYFYPDLPKGYQISQFEEPICSGGYVDVEVDGPVKRIRLNRIHMEEDAGKMVHVGAPGIWGSKASAIDFNRCSVPLLEIVTEPDISSPKEAREYVMMIRAILVSLGICDGNMEEGSLRCDANVSIRPVGSAELGVKTEIKNMNSFKAIEKALDYEIDRQRKMKKAGIPIEQETRLWDDSAQKTYLMRSKEESHDYRYFPDPDLLPLELTDEWINGLKDRLPLLPLERKKTYKEEYGFNNDEARLFMINPDYADFFEEVLKIYDKPRILANWFFSEILSYIDNDIQNMHIQPADLSEFLKKINSGEISGKIGKDVIKRAFATNKGLIEIIDQEGIKQIIDPDAIEKIVDEILEKNPSQVDLYRSGKTKIMGFFVGEVMKATNGKANPGMANEILREKLS
ncbi:MAG: Asp-tRNA(Asn)/Glu-tRNA(Gln) amidotransferase subunit GatB [Spirochaetota bacterium]|nr:Asp-tRNA(Asn)/Glu-tRNA(Gln) amidotransferase subunit GatB [Spirochaetota bacterium]